MGPDGESAISLTQNRKREKGAARTTKELMLQQNWGRSNRV